MSALLQLQRSISSIAWIALLLFVCRPASTQQSGVPARSVPLLLPSSIAYDALGNLYLSETQRHAIRKVDVQGNITTVAGDGTQGFTGDGGPASGAQLNAPQGLAVDSRGDVFIADSGNNRIRRIDALTGTIATIAGTGASGFAGDGGQATLASVDLPRALCVDTASKNLYIADTRNHRIRRVDLATGIILTVAGNGTQGFSGDGALAIAASLDSPSGMALNGAGDLFIADTRNGRVRRVAAGTGTITTIGTTGTTVAGAQALALPRGLAIDTQGNLYIAEAGSHQVLRIDGATGALSIVAGTGAQGFTGDGASAISASLDSPRAVAMSPAGLVSIADSGNQRVRQLMAAPAPDTSLQTIAGLGSGMSTIFSLSAPSVIAYGSGTMTAALQSATGASGNVTFVDVGNGSTAIINAGALVANVATVSLAGLAAGQHRIMATYAGDSTHAAAQTTTSLLTVTPLTRKATPASGSMIYGSQLPTISGSVAGLLPQDSDRVAVSFTTSATPSSPVGAYAITAALTGSGSANYTLQPDPADLVIRQAASSVTLQDQGPNGSFAETLVSQVSSSTSGVPTGAVALVDNGVTLQKTGISPVGVATFTSITLAAGTHALAATYLGDQNFLPSSSAALAEIITPVATTGDFTLAASGSSSQLLVAGSSISYSLAVQMTGGGISSPVALSVSGLPPFTKASFNPSYVPPASSGSATVALTISSLASSALYKPGWSSNCALLALSLPIFGFQLRRKFASGRFAPTAMALSGLFALLTVSGCGDRVNTAGQNTIPLQNYTLTVTGTTTDVKGSPLQHSANVVLKMYAAQ